MYVGNESLLESGMKYCLNNFLFTTMSPCDIIHRTRSISTNSSTGIISPAMWPYNWGFVELDEEDEASRQCRIFNIGEYSPAQIVPRADSYDGLFLHDKCTLMFNCRLVRS